MIGLGLALIVVGLVLIFFLGWFGIVVGVVGLILFVLAMAGFGRRAAENRP